MRIVASGDVVNVANVAEQNDFGGTARKSTRGFHLWSRKKPYKGERLMNAYRRNAQMRSCNLKRDGNPHGVVVPHSDLSEHVHLLFFLMHYSPISDNLEHHKTVRNTYKHSPRTA